MNLIKELLKLNEVQQVYLSKTQSGRTGFFTNRTLAYPIELKEYEELLSDKNKAKAKAAKLGFELIDTPE